MDYEREKHLLFRTKKELLKQPEKKGEFFPSAASVGVLEIFGTHWNTKLKDKELNFIILNHYFLNQHSLAFKASYKRYFFCKTLRF